MLISRLSITALLQMLYSIIFFSVVDSHNIISFIVIYIYFFQFCLCQMVFSL